MTARSKLALGFAAALAAILAGFSVAVYFAVERALMSAVDERLCAAAAAAEEEACLDLLVNAREADEPPLTEVVRVRDGALVYRSKDHADADGLARAGGRPRDLLLWRGPRSTLLPSGREVRLVAARALVAGEPYEVWMAEPLDLVRAEEKKLGLVLAVLFPLAIALALVGGRTLAGRAIRPIEDALAGARRFTADASHELRTPLATIRAECEVTLRKERPALEYRAALASVLEETERLSQLAAKLLDLSRADAPGGLALAREEVALEALLRDLCEKLGPLAAEKGIALELRENGGAAVSGDPRRLRELFEKLLENALQHTERGGRVVTSAARSGAAVAVEVADTGRGIAPEHLPHIFERFYRADPARPHGGAGLGLAIARAIAHAHGATIAVASEPGKGSRFTVRLPLG